MARYRVQLDVEVDVDDMEAVQRVAHQHTLNAFASNGGVVPNEFASTDQQAADYTAQVPVMAMSMLVAGAMHAGAHATFPDSARITGLEFRPLP